MNPAGTWPLPPLRKRTKVSDHLLTGHRLVIDACNDNAPAQPPVGFWALIGGFCGVVTAMTATVAATIHYAL